MRKARKNYFIYLMMLLIFGGLIYTAIAGGERFLHLSSIKPATAGDDAFTMFKTILLDNLEHPFSILLIQIIVVLIAVRIFASAFRYIGQPGVIGEIVAGIVLGPSLLGSLYPEFFGFLFQPDSLTNLELISQLGLVLFMFVIGMEVDFGVLKNKINETLVISHAGILVPFFLGMLCFLGRRLLRRLPAVTSRTEATAALTFSAVTTSSAAPLAAAANAEPSFSAYSLAI